MADGKPITVLWSKTAVTVSGPQITSLQARLLAEVDDIVPETHDWFLHSLSGENEDECYICTGNELPGRWEVYVQVARYKSMEPLSDDHSRPELRGKVIRFPEALKESDNEVFAPFEFVRLRSAPIDQGGLNDQTGT